MFTMKKTKRVTVTALASGLVIAGLAGAGIEDASAKVLLSDVSDKSTYYQDIQFVLQKGIMSTTANMKFLPNKSIEREIAAEYVGVAIEIDKTKVDKTIQFKDLSVSSAKYPYVATLTSMKAFTSSANFNGKKAITRQEVARLIVEAYDFPITKGTNFTDTKSSDYKDYVSTAVSLGLMKARKTNTFSPNTTVTRAEFARILRLAELKADELEKTKPSTGGTTTTKPSTGSNTTTPPATGGSNTSKPSTGGTTTTKPSTGSNTTTPPVTGSGNVSQAILDLVGPTGAPYVNHPDVKITGNQLVLFGYPAVTIQTEPAVEEVSGLRAGILNAMIESNRKMGNNATLINDPELDKLAQQRLEQWNTIWVEKGESVAKTAMKNHFKSYYPDPSDQIVFYNNKYNEVNEILTSSSDLFKYGATPEGFGKSIVANFNTSNLHAMFYRDSTNGSGNPIAFGIGYKKNPKGGYNILIVNGLVIDTPNIAKKLQ